MPRISKSRDFHVAGHPFESLWPLLPHSHLTASDWWIWEENVDLMASHSTTCFFHLCSLRHCSYLSRPCPCEGDPQSFGFPGAGWGCCCTNEPLSPKASAHPSSLNQSWLGWGLAIWEFPKFPTNIPSAFNASGEK